MTGPALPEEPADGTRVAGINAETGRPQTWERDDWPNARSNQPERRWWVDRAQAALRVLRERAESRQTEGDTDARPTA